MIAPSLNQKSTLSDAMSKKEWMITQFGEENLRNRIRTALENASIKQYGYLMHCMFNGKASTARKIFINLGLKPNASTILHIM